MHIVDHVHSDSRTRVDLRSGEAIVYVNGLRVAELNHDEATVLSNQLYEAGWELAMRDAPTADLPPKLYATQERFHPHLLDPKHSGQRRGWRGPEGHSGG